MAYNRLSKSFKYLILALCIAWITISSPRVTDLARAQTTQQQAQHLSQKAQAALDGGNPEAAIESWQQATQLYRQLHNQTGISRTLIGQSMALQEQGNVSLACTTLLESLSLETDGWVCNSFLNPPPPDPLRSLALALQQPAPTPITLAGLQELGGVLLRLGALQESELVLQMALKQSQRLADREHTSDLLVSLGNTEQALYRQARERYTISGDLVLQEEQLATALTQARSALQRYAQSITTAPQTPSLQAHLNGLSLLEDAQQWAAANAASDPRLQAFQAEIARQIPPLLKELQAPDAFNQLPPAESVYSRLKFAQQLDQLNQPSAATLQAQQALQVAQTLDDPRLKSYSLGILGQISPQAAQSQLYLEQALELALQTESPDMAYQWQHELGQLYRHQGNHPSAIATYQAALNSLDQVRGNLTLINPDLQFSFRDQVEPVYREYMQLLLASANPNLDQVIQTNERLQLAQLENFLRCGRLPLRSLDTIQANLSDAPTVVHVISLPDRYEVIVRSPDRSLHRYTPEPNQLRTSAENLLRLIQDPGYQYSEPLATQAQGQSLYQLLLAPARQDGAIPPAGTLVFVLDGVLQNLPMALLHDGHDYLIRNYSLAVALSSQLQQPRQLEKEKLSALVAGLSKRSPSFDAPNAPRGIQPLPQTQMEVASVLQSVEAAEDLLNQDFTAQRLQVAFAQRNYSILHLSTHVEFSSDPKQTVLLDWNQALDVQQLNQLLKRTLPGEPAAALNLLVLSACQSAKGDKRSALGLAGVAVQAGARSTLASLWRVNADSTAQLMRQFYHHLKADTKAEAVRQAQLALLGSTEKPEWHHPYYWSSFILAGDWT